MTVTTVTTFFKTILAPEGGPEGPPLRGKRGALRAPRWPRLFFGSKEGARSAPLCKGPLRGPLSPPAQKLKIFVFNNPKVVKKSGWGVRPKKYGVDPSTPRGQGPPRGPTN